MRILTLVALLAFHFFPISAHAGIAYSFDGQALKLRTAKGDDVKLRNGNCDKGWDGCIVHNFRGTILDDKFYVVDVHYYEGGQTELFSYKTGTKTAIYGEPHVSPKQNLIIATYASEGTGSENNGIYLYEVVDDEVKEVFRYKPDGYALYSFRGWYSNDVAIINLTTVCRNNGSEWLEMTVKLTNTTEGWQLDQGHGEECIISGKVK